MEKIWAHSGDSHFLEPEDKASGRKIMICVSRLNGQEIVLDL